VIEGPVNIRILRFYDVSVVIATCNRNFEGESVSALGVVMGHGPGPLHSPTWPLNILVQNCIGLELDL